MHQRHNNDSTATRHARDTRPPTHPTRAASDLQLGACAGEALGDVERCRNRRLAAAMAAAAAGLAARLLPQLSGCPVAAGGCLDALVALHGALVTARESAAAAAVGGAPMAALEAQVRTASSGPLLPALTPPPALAWRCQGGGGAGGGGAGRGAGSRASGGPARAGCCQALLPPT
jgi:hypothetical protein